MPSTSVAQHNAMEAAAHGHSTLGIPQKVGKEFVAADSAVAAKGAGIMFRTEANTVLFLKRGPGGDFPGFWCFPGGTTEDDETPEQTAERETIEEIGHLPEGPKTLLLTAPARDLRPEYTTFQQKAEEEFAPELNGEHVGWAWAPADQPPEPLHPGCAVALQMLTANELDIARLISTGDLASPQRYLNFWMFAIRITGTGWCYRAGKDQFAWRDPAMYLNPEFLARCNGVPVIWEHPKRILDSKEYADRNIGSIFLPYIWENDVWGITKVYDDDSVAILRESQLSTSPCVVTVTDEVITLDDGTKAIKEGEPRHIDHIAICDQGVWDKGGEPIGVRADSAGDFRMADKEEDRKVDEAKEKADGDPGGNLKNMIEGVFAKIDARMDAWDARMDAFEKKDKKADASEEEDEGDKKEEKADAKKDSKKDAKKDEDEKEEEKAEEKSDSAKIRARLDAMEANMPTAMSDADCNALADAQMKADSVFQALGKSAPKPIPGERPLAYRRRLAGDLRQHSERCKGVNLEHVAADSAGFGIIEDQIYADAMAFARTPLSVPAGELRSRKTTTDAGHTIIEYTGDFHKAFGAFMLPSQVMRPKSLSDIARGL